MEAQEDKITCLKVHSWRIMGLEFKVKSLQFSSLLWCSLGPILMSFAGTRDSGPVTPASEYLLCRWALNKKWRCLMILYCLFYIATIMEMKMLSDTSHSRTDSEKSVVTEDPFIFLFWVYLDYTYFEFINSQLVFE